MSFERVHPSPLTSPQVLLPKKSEAQERKACAVAVAGAMQRGEQDALRELDTWADAQRPDALLRVQMLKGERHEPGRRAAYCAW